MSNKMSELDRELEKLENAGKQQPGHQSVDDPSSDEAKVCGFNYYKAVYVMSGGLIALMLYIFAMYSSDSPIRKMALVQGSLTISLLFILAWF